MICGAEIFAFLAGFAWRNTNGRLPDMTVLLVIVPSAVFAIALLMALLWAFFARISLQASLLFIARILPLAWLVPVADLVRSGGRGFILTATPFDGGGVLLASLTGTLLPAQAALPMGLRLGMFAAALLAAFVVWFTRRGHGEGAPTPASRAWDAARAVATGLAVSITMVFLTFFPAVLGAWHGLLQDHTLPNSTVTMAHATLRAVTNGYWWTNLYDRFPSSVEAQADLAVRLTASGFAVLILGLLLGALCARRSLLPKALIRDAYWSWPAMNLPLYAVGAALLTVLMAQTPAATGTWWMALVVALCALGAFRLHIVLERCLHRASLGVGEAHPQQVCEGVSRSDAEQISFVALLYALLASFALGWPIFAAFLVFLACSTLSRDPLWAHWPWAATVFRGFGAASLALSGFFFATQQARFTGIAALLMLLAAAHRMGSEWLYTPKKSLSTGSQMGDEHIP
jgi:hypothetical protein